VEGLLLVLAGVFEEYGKENGNIFGREFRGVLEHGEPFAWHLLDVKR